MTLTFAAMVVQILTGLGIFTIVIGVALGISLWLKEGKV